MSQVQSSGLADLEKELICSICTELLYQPLTLLDCLHTFCGSCVKEWFSAQGSRRSRASPRFTCPACRAEVRETRPNATVTTLLDMVLTAHPDRARAADEKAEIATKYTHGESVFPALPSGGESAEEDGVEDGRILAEVRELSLRESRAQARRETRRTGQSSRTRERSTNTERPAEDGRSRRRRDDDTTQQHHTSRPDDSDRTRRVEHQSSLRSLLSLSSDVETMEEEILRQILEDGLLDNINLDNLGPRQEEELSERIADAYRRKHMQRSQPRQRQEQGPEQRPEADGATRTHVRSESAHRTAEPTAATRAHSARRPPVSRPHLFDSPPTRPSTAGHQRHSSEQVSGRPRTSPVRTNQASASDEAIRPAARFSGDLITDRHISQAGRLRSESASARPRRATESEQNIPRAWAAGGRDRSSSRPSTSQSATNFPTSGAALSNFSRHLPPTDHTTPSLSSPLVPIRSDRRTRPSPSRSNVPVPPIIQFTEPSISCDRCGKDNIQYNLHKKCPSCKEGNFHLCLRCYRLGRGCLRWNGFGASALTTFQQIILSSTRRSVQVRDPGHVLLWFRYQRPAETAHRTMSRERQMTDENPVRRLQSGLFCDSCQSWANDCFWKCNQCNEGDWGFCNFCVNQGRCCTHALLPIRRMTHCPPSSALPTISPPAESNTIPTSSDTESFKILSFSTNCDICTYPIPASNTRYHCLECNSGDYDVCTNCYLKLVATGKINKENGHNGWRRCLAGHRMIVVGFEDHEEGQRRVIIRDLVGGRALNEQHVIQSQIQSPTSSLASGGLVASPELGTGDWTWKDGPERRKKASRLRGGPAPTNSITGGTTSASDPSHPSLSSATATPMIPPFRRFPPDGGVGLIVRALWSWYPEEEVRDELVFPRGAHITESENINDDWFWGCYAGRTGLFPGSHVEFVREVHR
ncbi:Zinc finger, ZZ-type [Penicillium digitatum]|nr:Zinc finger, ZZ-type [Penicillium digitatum]